MNYAKKTRIKYGILAALGLAGFLLFPRLASAETTSVKKIIYQNFF